MMYTTENEELPALMETLETMVSYGQTDLVTMSYFDYIGWLQYSPPQVFEYLLNQELVESCIKNLENRERLFLLGKLLEKFGATQSEDWKRLIKRFVRMGVNYYDYSYHTRSLIDHCFLRCRDPIESRVVGDEWLEILSSTGVDVHDYLQMEMRRHPMKPPRIRHQFPYVDDRRRLIFSLEGTPTVYWEWWIDPREPGSLVCSEFIYLCRNDGDSLSYTPNNGPFIRPYWKSCEICVSNDREASFLKDGRNNIERAKIVKQVEARFERRMQKRAIKQRKAMGLESRRETYRGPRVPGAWIE